LNLNAYSIPKSRGSLLVAEWEDRRIDWAVIVSEALIREVSTTRKKYPAGLAYWLALIYPPTQGTEKGGSRPSSKGVELVMTDARYCARQSRQATQPDGQQALRAPDLAGQRRHRHERLPTMEVRGQPVPCLKKTRRRRHSVGQRPRPRRRFRNPVRKEDRHHRRSWNRRRKQQSKKMNGSVHSGNGRPI
jgi:hypothetical protein